MVGGQIRLLPEGVKRPQMQWNVLRWSHASAMAEGQPDPSWVYGTLHSDDARVTRVPAAVSAALAQSRRLAPEILRTPAEQRAFLANLTAGLPPAQEKQLEQTLGCILENARRQYSAPNSSTKSSGKRSPSR